MDLEDYLLALRSWWSRKYDRPLKDEVLQTYTFEELLYEFNDYREREAARSELSKENGDKMEEGRLQESLDWAEQEELRELEEYKKKQAQLAKQPEGDPTVYTPSDDDKEWMEKVMKEEAEKAEEALKQAKEKYGSDFGEDITGSFDDGGQQEE